MLVDANLLLYAVDRASPFHEAATQWLTAQLNGRRRIGLPWLSLTAFLRLATHPRVFDSPLSPAQARAVVDGWLGAEVTWVPNPTDRHGAILGDLVERHHLTGNLVSDAHLAALSIEHGLTVCSSDSDFGRFPEVTWTNPLS